jgi:dCTP deaminase
LDNNFWRLRENTFIDTKSTSTDDLFEKMIVGDNGLVIRPGDFYLANSVEKISLSKKICGDLFQLSCYARVGISVNFSSNHIASTFGYDNPSTITFEIINLSKNPIRIYPGVKFCHLRLHHHVSKSNSRYQGIYESPEGPKAANFYLKPAR